MAKKERSELPNTMPPKESLELHNMAKNERIVHGEESG
jgi:hypothetical protein